MAEARRAVEPLPSLSLETPIDPTLHNVQVHRTGVGISIFIPSPRILCRNAWRSTKQWALKAEHAFAPFPTPLVVTVAIGGIASTINGASDSALRNGLLGRVLWKWDTNYNVILHLVERQRGGVPVPVGVRVGYLAVIGSCGVVFSYAFLQRCILRNLLAYSGWMDETRAKKKSTKTILWALLLNFVYIRGGANGKVGSSVVIGPNITQDPVIEKYRSQKQLGKKKGGIVSKISSLLKRFMWTPPTSTQAYQTSLPAQPVPSVEDTLKRYCTSMGPLILQQQQLPDDSPQKKMIAFDSVEDLEMRCKAFLASEGPTLQRYLQWKFITSPNYVSDWWMKFVYLRGRDSLMINSNYYGTSLFKPVPTTNQASRAAFFTYILGQLVKEVAKERIPTLVIQGMVPMCMDQYKLAFGTTRIPGKDCDRLVTLEYRETLHIAVLHRGRVYKMPLYDPKTGKQLEPCQLEVAFKGILEDSSTSSNDDNIEGAMLGSLTAWNRGLWAEARETFFLPHRVNRTSLKVIEKALFVVSLDHESDNDLLNHASSPAASKVTRGNPSAAWNDLTGLGNNFMYGNGANRWFDKSLNLIVTPTGMAGMNGEHTWADATTLGHLWEIVLARETYSSPYNTAADSDGSIVDRSALKSPSNFFPAQRLHFALSVQAPLHNNVVTVVSADGSATTSTVADTTTIATDLAGTIRNAYNSATNQIADIDLMVARFDEFGKGNIKKAKCSPDAFIQMALQVAFYKQRGFFVQTYESASARLYRDGRTETIRSCSQESCDFVSALIDFEKNGEGEVTDNNTKKARLQGLLRKACEKHVHTSTLAGSGRGVDRHLFALYVVSVGTETDSPFLQSVMKHGWKLSTSQVPQQQANNEWLPGHTGDLIPRPSGGFGPVADDGYGVSYVICGEESFFFHVSSKRSCPDTDSTVFRDAIFDALRTMNALF